MILIDYKDRRPIYEQIVDKIEDLIRMGVLSADEKLPSVRQLAAEISTNPNTIQKAYAELERRGIIYTVKGRGNFVSITTEDIKSSRISEIYNSISEELSELLALGVDKMLIIDTIRNNLEKLSKGAAT